MKSNAALKAFLDAIKARTDVERAALSSAGLKAAHGLSQPNADRMNRPSLARRQIERLALSQDAKGQFRAPFAKITRGGTLNDLRLL